MQKQEVAIIGAGIVGASAAYILSKDSSISLTIYDDGTGQGTSAAAGIISPWLSKRRNQKWYRMVRDGAAFYPNFLNEVMNGQAIPEDVYKKVGTLLFKKKEQHLYELLKIGLQRRKAAPEIGELAIISPDKIRELVPIYTKNTPALWASGGARVDGQKLVQLLIEKSVKNGASFRKENVSLKITEESQLSISTSEGIRHFDKVILAVSAWLPDLLSPFGYDVDIRPQKGQLVQVKLDGYQTENWPVIMPEGEKDITPFENGQIVIGATHENDASFDLTVEKTALDAMIKEAADNFSNYFSTSSISAYRSGTRAYTSDFSPFFGKVPGQSNLFAASGLGSTGLTAGPLVGLCLAQLVLGEQSSLPEEDYPIGAYIKK